MLLSVSLLFLVGCGGTQGPLEYEVSENQKSIKEELERGGADVE